MPVRVSEDINRVGDELLSAESENYFTSSSHAISRVAVKPPQKLSNPLKRSITLGQTVYNPASPLGNALMATFFNTFSGILLLTLICISAPSPQCVQTRILKFQSVGVSKE